MNKHFYSEVAFWLELLTLAFEQRIIVPELFNSSYERNGKLKIASCLILVKRM